jgi:hypothetical protein
LDAGGDFAGIGEENIDGLSDFEVGLAKEIVKNFPEAAGEAVGAETGLGGITIHGAGWGVAIT